MRAHSDGHGRGAELEFRLPAIVAARQPAPPPAEPALEPAPASPARAASGRILEVDDNTDAATALSAAQSDRPDAVVLDGQDVLVARTHRAKALVTPLGVPPRRAQRRS